VLKTRQKILLARSLQIVVMAFRHVFRLGPVSNVTRKCLRWHLDLREGIDFSIWLLGSFEPKTIRCYSAIIKPGDTVLDIGANIGAHTVPIAELVGENGRVIAFEPTDYAFSKLCKNVAANPKLAGRVKCLQTMLIDSIDGTTPPPLYSSWPLAQEHGLHAEHRGKLMSTNGASATTLDTALDALSPDRVDCVKVDIDGFECQMLRGASKCLSRWHPVLVMELSPYVLDEQGDSVEELLRILVEHGYSIYTLDGATQISTDPKAIRRMIPTGAGINVLARAER